jgi:membrane fusion protein, multidrug efflux system
MNPSTSHRTARIVAGFAALVALAFAVRWLGSPAAAQERGPAHGAAAPVVVTTARVEARDVPIIRSGVGTVQPDATVTVKTRIDGELVRVGFVEGQDVRSGQLLAQLDDRPIQAQLAQAQAQQARDSAQLANARTDLRRFTELVAEDAATRQQVDTQKALVAQLEAAVQTDAALVQYQRVQLAYTRITAPMAGRAGVRLVDPGNIVHASDPNGLVVINRIDPVVVSFTLPEEAVQDVLQAQRATRTPLAVTAFAREGGKELAQGELTLLNNQVDAATGTVLLKARFRNGGYVLWPGQFVDARLRLGLRRGALTVPQPALQRGQDGTYVYTVDAQQRAHVVPVQVVQEQDGIAVIASGLRAGERVVVDGQYKLKPDALVAEAPPAGNRGGGK